MRCWYHGLRVDGTHGIPRAPALFSALVRSLIPVCALVACASRARVIPPEARMRLDVAEPVLMGPIETAPATDARAWAPLADGSRVVITDDGAALVAPDGSVSARRPLREPARCTPRAWGARGLVFCPDEGDDPASIPSPAPRMAVLRGDPDVFLPSRDGLALTREGPCDGDAPATGAVLTACSYEDGQWREWRTDAPGALLDRYGSLALATRCVRGAPCEVGLYDIDLARWRPVLLPDATARWVRGGFDTDGALVGIVHTGAREAVGWAVRGAPGAAMRALRLPAPVDDAATDGRDRAVFLRGAEAWITDDGGVSLRPVRGCVVSAATNASDTSLRMGRRAACEGALCAIATRCAVRARVRGADIP